MVVLRVGVLGPGYLHFQSDRIETTPRSASAGVPARRLFDPAPDARDDGEVWGLGVGRA